MALGEQCLQKSWCLDHSDGEPPSNFDTIRVHAHDGRKQTIILRPHGPFRSDVEGQLPVSSWSQGTQHHGQDVGPYGHL